MAIRPLRDDDSSLLERILLGDNEAVASLYDRYATGAYSIAFRVLGDRVLAEQIVCDLFLAIYREPKPFLQVKGSLAPALAIMARN